MLRPRRNICVRRDLTILDGLPEFAGEHFLCAISQSQLAAMIGSTQQGRASCGFAQSDAPDTHIYGRGGQPFLKRPEYFFVRKYLEKCGQAVLQVSDCGSFWLGLPVCGQPFKSLRGIGGANSAKRDLRRCLGNAKSRTSPAFCIVVESGYMAEPEAARCILTSTFSVRLE